MNRRRLHGQHFLVSGVVASRIARMSGATTDDTVLEVGTGRGILTRRLCCCAGRVVSIESDYSLYTEAASGIRAPNLVLLHGDGFSAGRRFDVFASNLPYSQSRRAIHWLASTPFRCGVVMVQEEFARKLAARGSSRRAVSVVWQKAFEVTGSMHVPPDCFDPPPGVRSVALSFVKKDTLPMPVIQSIHRLFSSRRKMVSGTCRIDELPSEQVVDIASSMR